MKTQSEFLFEESQHFTQWWLWMIIGLAALTTNLVFGYGLFQQLILGKPWGSSPLQDELLLIVSLFTITSTGAVLLLFYTANLQTRISKAGVAYRFTPFIRSWKMIVPDNIVAYSAQAHKAFGYGVRITFQGVVLLNVRGSQAVQITRQDGSAIAFGTQQPEKFLEALHHICSSTLS
ncbi:MAG: hypothetical protein KF775_10120 [Cyclobacteriaceae bacterium]|nr:hypothetical protein [Cyclobacteriaceae bacterium]